MVCGQKSSGGVGERVIRSWMKVGGRGYLCKSVVTTLFSPAFPPNLEGKKNVGSGEKTFSQVFYPSHFPSLTKQWKTAFSTLFSFLYFLSSLFSPQPNTPLESLSMEFQLRMSLGLNFKLNLFFYLAYLYYYLTYFYYYLWALLYFLVLFMVSLYYFH